MKDEHMKQLMDTPIRLAPKAPLPTARYFGPPPATRVEYIDLHSLAGASTSTTIEPKSSKQFLILITAVFAGTFGFDRFLAGRPKTGALKLVTLGGMGLWWLYDICMLLLGKYLIDGQANLRPPGFGKIASLVISLYCAIAGSALFVALKLFSRPETTALMQYGQA